MFALPSEDRALVYFVSGMWCSTCAKTVQDRAMKTDGVDAAEVSYPTKLLLVRVRNQADFSRVDEQIMAKVEGIGFGIRRQSKGWLASFKDDLEKEQGRRISNIQVSIVWFLAMWSSMIAMAGYLGNGLTYQERYLLSLASSCFGIPAILVGILPYGKSGLRALRSSRLWTLDFFIFIGGCSAMAVSWMHLASGRAETYADSGSMIVALLLLTKIVENAAARRLSTSILYQINRFSDEIEVLRKGAWQWAKAAQVKKGDRVRVRAGNTVVFDGSLASPHASLNCHLLTGENTSVPNRCGDSLLAGAIANSDLEMIVKAPLGSRKIDDWAESALISGSRSHAHAKLWLRLEGALTMVALLAAIGVAAAHWVRGADMSKTTEAFFIGILIFCPCLFASIVPMTKQMVHLALLKMGVMIHRTESLSQLSRVKRVYLDKTGTLEAVESDVTYFDPQEKEHILSLLRELAMKTHHPILREIIADKSELAEQDRLADIEEIPGCGVKATISDGSKLWVGQAKFVLSQAGIRSKIMDSIHPLIAINQKVVGQIIVKTLFDEQAKAFLATLLRMFRNVEVEILSGDPNPHAGQDLVSIDPRRISYRGRLSPEEKAEAIRSHSLYVGDGLNDTLALAKADVSCRLGHRVLGFAPVDLQLQTPDLNILLSLLTYARTYKRIQVETVILAFTYNLIALSLAAMGKFSPLGAVIAMLTSFSLLFLSSLRLLKPARILEGTPLI